MSKPIRSWADIVEAYRPAVMQAGKRPAGCPKVSVFEHLEIVIVGNESYYGAADFGESTGDCVRMIRNEMTGPPAAGFNMVVRHCKDSSSNSFAPIAHSSRAASLRKPRCWRTTEDNRSVPLIAARTYHFDHTGKVARRQPGLAQIVGVPSGQRDSECKSSILEGN
jgi:hypothetical protein